MTSNHTVSNPDFDRINFSCRFSMRFTSHFQSRTITANFIVRCTHRIPPVHRPHPPSHAQFRLSPSFTPRNHSPSPHSAIHASPAEYKHRKHDHRPFNHAPITSIPQDMALLPIPAETNTHPSAYGTVPCPHPHPPPRPSAQLQFPITITHPQFTHSHSPNVQLCERRQPDWWLRLGDRLSQLTEN